MRISDWSSDVCSSDLASESEHFPSQVERRQRHRADAGIEARHIAAAGQYSDTHWRYLFPFGVQDTGLSVWAMRLNRGELYNETRRILSLAWPVILTSLNWPLLHLIDVSVVGHVSTHALGAIAAGRALTDVTIVIGIAILSGVLVFTARAEIGRAPV